MDKVGVWISKRQGKRGAVYRLQWINPRSGKTKTETVGRDKTLARLKAAEHRRELETGQVRRDTH